MSGYLYLASPYTHSDPVIREWRYHAVMDFAAFLLKQRIWVFGPIMHSHELAKRHQLPYTFEFWNDWNRAMIVNSNGIIVFQINGWRSSKGVTAEIQYGMDIGKPIAYSKVTWKNYDHPEEPIL